MARFMHGGVVGGLRPTSIDFRHWALANSAGSTVTVSVSSFGDAAANKWAIVFVCTWQGTINPQLSITSPTIGGAAASVIYTSRQSRGAGLVYDYSVFTAQIDAVTTGNVVFTDNTAFNPFVVVATTTGYDLSSESDSDASAGATGLTVDCPARGCVLGVGSYGTSGAASGAFANLNALDHQNQSYGGTTLAGAGFVGAQSGLSVSYTPSSYSAKSQIALSFAGV